MRKTRKDTIREMKSHTVNIMGYSSLLIKGKYGRLNQRQREVISTMLIEAQEAMATTL